MNRAFYVDALATAERHIALSKEYIANQCRIIGQLDTRGLDLGEANQLLATFLDSQQALERTRQRLIDKIASCSSSEA